MSVRILWHSLVFILTLALIYILFPILIVPSKLPPVQSAGSPDAQIYQLEVPRQPSLKNTISDLRQRHQQGMKLILAPFAP
ncbi:MAG: hypothetical protein NTZ93_04590 [Candidatus Beckwithbacteria bacterium]|nr:hypothetical protein [Candidatus Beckwithbacteria bacterium]